MFGTLNIVTIGLKFEISWEAFHLYCCVRSVGSAGTAGITSVSNTSLCDVERLVNSEQVMRKYVEVAVACQQLLFLSL
jgi:hypothetical protein